MADALWRVISGANVCLQNVLIFLPSRRAVRTVEKMIAEKMGGATVLPHLVPLGAEVDDIDAESDASDYVISNMSRVIMLAKLLSADASIGNIKSALPVATDLVRMSDYLENEGVNVAEIDWSELVDEKYAAHFQRKATLLNILSRAMAMCSDGRITSTAKRNSDIRAWRAVLDKYDLVIVCASTASVPATADLMAEVATRENGRIILSGKISGDDSDLELDTHPYHSEYKFLTRIGVGINDVIPIDVGASAIDFMNTAFGNSGTHQENNNAISHCHLINCPRESVEAACVAEIAARAIQDKKSVLVITPDAAGNQRIATEFARRGILADFSGATSGGMTKIGRAILNLFDGWIEQFDDNTFHRLYAESGNDIFEMIVRLIDSNEFEFAPRFDYASDESVQVMESIKNLSAYIATAEIQPTTEDMRALLAYAISSVQIRANMNTDAPVVVLGTIESRMQTADIVILTGLNENMFPACGYENAWLPRDTALKIGLPPPEHKVSLMALDFMNLSCAPNVYWLRSTNSGGVQTSESRFLSRVQVIAGDLPATAQDEILSTVLARDNIASNPLDYTPPVPPRDRSDVFVTELELLIHNPYAFYAKHILKLKPIKDYWVGADPRDFGNIVHDVLENAQQYTVPNLIAELDSRARDKVNENSIIYHFWHNRFVEIAPFVIDEIKRVPNSYSEINGAVEIAKRSVRARADRIWDGGVLDIKTGAAPSAKQLELGNMPQLPLEAYILQQGGFPIKTTEKSKTPVMRFLQLQANHVATIEYDETNTADMICAAVKKTTEVFNMFTSGNAPYEYRDNSDGKYRDYDDLARALD